MYVYCVMSIEDKENVDAVFTTLEDARQYIIDKHDSERLDYDLDPEKINNYKRWYYYWHYGAMWYHAHLYHNEIQRVVINNYRDPEKYRDWQRRYLVNNQLVKDSDFE